VTVIGEWYKWETVSLSHAELCIIITESFNLCSLIENITHEYYCFPSILAFSYELQLPVKDIFSRLISKYLIVFIAIVKYTF
jgi:hypothetical protein